MNFKKLKLLAKLATSALALNMLGINEPISAMEQASGELSDEQKKQVEQKLDGILERLNKLGGTYLESQIRKANFLNLIYALIIESGKITPYHKYIFEDLEFTVCESILNPHNHKLVKFECIAGVGTVKNSHYLMTREYREVLPFLRECFDDFRKYSEDQQDHFWQCLHDAFGTIPKNQYRIVRENYSSTQNYADNLIRAIRHEFRILNKKKPNPLVNCVICYESLKKEPIISELGCGHLFHIECLARLVSEAIEEQRTPRCPVCREFLAKCEIENVTSAKVRHVKSKSLSKKLKMNI